MLVFDTYLEKLQCVHLYAQDHQHYCGVIMGAMASQITSLTIVNTTVYSGADQWKQSSASLAFVRGIHRWKLTWETFSTVFFVGCIIVLL